MNEMRGLLFMCLSYMRIVVLWASRLLVEQMNLQYCPRLDITERGPGRPFTQCYSCVPIPILQLSASDHGQSAGMLAGNLIVSSGSCKEGQIADK